MITIVLSINHPIYLLAEWLQKKLPVYSDDFVAYRLLSRSYLPSALN